MPQHIKPTCLAITMGDPAGIGPEIIAKALPRLQGAVEKGELALLVIGNADALRAAQDQLGLAVPAGSFRMIDVGPVPGPLVVGQIQAAGGEWAYRAVVRAVELVQAGEADAIVTAPLSKEALNLAGHPFAGHTELLAHLTGMRDGVMMLAHGPMRVSHVTTHCPIAEVPRRITPERLHRVIDVTLDALRALGINKPRLAIAGLNPHSGEGGILGKEDETVIAPVIREYAEQGHAVTGPWPGDTVFIKLRAEQFDGVVAMFHDQGHIPVKLLGFNVDPASGVWQAISGVNITLGLPILRTSVDHGTAFDIAGKGVANADSLIDAAEYALRLIAGKRALAAAADVGTLHAVPEDARRIQADIPTPCVQNHAANLAVIPNGDLVCAWFGGTQEGMADISIHFARLPKGSTRWTDATKLSDDPTRSEQNPVLFPAPDGRLWLLYTAQRTGNQDTAFVRCRISDDNGLTWGPIRTLIDVPGTFVRQPIVVAPDGAWLLPVFHCRARPGEKWVGDFDTSSVLVSTDQGETWTAHPVPRSTGCVHMNIVPGAKGELFAFYRSRWADRMHRSRSTDGGRTWSEPEPTTMPNNNSSIQVIRLADGRLAYVGNPTSAQDAAERRVSLYDEIEDDEALPGTSAAIDAAPAIVADPAGRTAFWGTPRAPLRVALSDDDGMTWPHWRDLEVGDGYCMTNDSVKQKNREYSYPSIAQTSDGALNIAYTVFRQKIRHVRIDEAWVLNLEKRSDPFSEKGV